MRNNTVVLLLPTYYFLLLIFVFGTIIGSFLNVVILRHEKEESLTGRSHCPNCQKILRWYELVPVFSWLIQKGKCRGCSAPISVQYPLVELVTGILFIGVFLVHFGMLGSSSSLVLSPFTSNLLPLTFPLSPITFPPFLLSTFYLLLSLTLWSLLIVITVYDFRTKLVPNRFSYAFAALALVSALISPLLVSSDSITYDLSPVTLLAGPLLFAPFFILWYISDGKWLGLGDGKLALGIGWFLGPVGGLSAILFAFWIGALVSIALIAVQHVARFPSLRRVLMRFISTRAPSPRTEQEQSLSPTPKRLTLKSEIPFAPFMVLGTALVYFTSVTILTLL